MKPSHVAGSLTKCRTCSSCLRPAAAMQKCRPTIARPPDASGKGIARVCKYSEFSVLAIQVFLRKTETFVGKLTGSLGAMDVWFRSIE